MRINKRTPRIGAAVAAALCLLAVPAAADRPGSVAVEQDRELTLPEAELPEIQGSNWISVNTTDDTADASPGDGSCADAGGACSLRAAVQEANASGEASVIRLKPFRTYTLAIGGTGEDAAATGDLDVTGQLTIDGRGATVDADGIDRAFDVGSNGLLETRFLRVRNGAVTDESGGGYRNAGALTLIASSVANSSATGAGASGGAIFNDGGALVVFFSKLSGGDATRAGGAIEANGGRTEVISSQLTGNHCGPMPGNGGALHLTGTGRVDVRTSLVQSNVADAEGGGLWNSEGGRMTVDNSQIRGNAALGADPDQGGGGLFNDGGFLQISDSTVADNTATVGSGSGGGLFNNRGVLRVRKTDVKDNDSNRAGGGIEAVAGATDIWSSKLRGNDTGASPGNGGGLHLTGAGFVTVDKSEVSNNTASAEGGGLWVSGVGTMFVSWSTIDDNVASGDAADQGGGGLFNDGGFLRVSDSKIRDNLADGSAGSGGGVLNNQGELELYDCDVIDNESRRAGGGVEANVGFTILDKVDLRKNRTGFAPGNGGGLHLTGAGEVVVRFGKVRQNEAGAEGGGLWNSSTGTMTVNYADIYANDAPVGPNVFNDGGTFTIDGQPVPAGP